MSTFGSGSIDTLSQPYKLTRFGYVYDCVVIISFVDPVLMNILPIYLLQKQLL